MSAARLLVALVTAAVVLGAVAGCSPSVSDPAPTSEAPVPADVGEVLGALADEIVIPGYQALSAELGELRAATAELCEAPGPDALEGARAAWRTAVEAWQRTRAFGVGPAAEERLMGDVGFAARAPVITYLLEGEEPVDPEAVADEGAAARGLYAAELALFGEGADALATDDGARRCEYVASVALLAERAVAPITAAWVDGDARGRFVDGLDGGPQSTVDLLVNELSFRVQEIEAVGLADLAAASSIDDLDAARRGGPGEHRLAERQALLAGVSAVVGDAEHGVAALVGARSPSTRDRLIDAQRAAGEALAVLPPSMADALGQPDDVDVAADAVAALRVVLATEVASQLGVTITFSDSDGDS